MAKRKEIRLNEMEIDRRDFLKKATLTGGILLTSGIVRSNTGGLSKLSELLSDENSNHPMMDEILKGVCDIHIHAAPDSSPYVCN